MVTISMCSWNRPIYLLKVLNGLYNSLQYYTGHVRKLIISIDKVDPCTAQQMIEAIECSNILTAIDTDIVFQQEHLGCTGNTRYCLERSFENGEHYTIHLEDDTYPGHDLIEYFENAAKILDNGYFAACTFHRPCHELIAPISGATHRLVSKKMFEGAGGFAITRKRWDRILEMGGMFGVEYIPETAKRFDCRGEAWRAQIKESDRLGFDWPFDRYFSEGLPSLYPIVSRVINIGKAGLHLNPEQWQKTHFNPNWIDSPVYDLKSNVGKRWDLEHILVDEHKYLEDRYE
jgi:hypothetical protein